MPEHAQHPSPSSSRQGRRPRVLVFDDDPSIRQFLETALNADYEVRARASGESMPQVMEEFQPDLVIMDVRMPLVDGLQLTRMIRQDARFERVPVLFLTAQGDNETFLRSLQVGGDGYLVKPFSLNNLLTRIRELLEEAGNAGG
jgi:DNA-binding response OmpR family regulator